MRVIGVWLLAVASGCSFPVGDFQTADAAAAKSDTASDSAMSLVDTAARDAAMDVTCAPGKQSTNCFGTCVDLVSDPLNCGMCGRRCDMGAPCKGSRCD